MFIYLMIFKSVSIFNRSIKLESFDTITCIYYLTYVIKFNLRLVSNLLVVTYECYLVERFGYYRRFLFARIILFYPCLMCDRLAVIYECITNINALYAPVRSKWATCVCTHSFLLAIKLFMLVLFTVW